MTNQELKKSIIKLFASLSLLVFFNIAIFTISNLFSNPPEIVKFFLSLFSLISILYIFIALYFILPLLICVHLTTPSPFRRVKDNEIKNFKPVRLDASQDERIINK